MIYLLALGWPWFAAAGALGALVGFLTFKPAKDAAFSGGWVIVVGALALAAGALVSSLELLNGSGAATFDIALLASGAYAAGLPAGGWVKSLGGAEDVKRRPAIAPVVVATAPVAAPQPSAAPALAASAPEPEAAAPPPQGKAPAAAKAKTASPGAKPEVLAAPRNGLPDDLSRIKGVGPRSVEKLHALGVFHYDQIAMWTLDNARWIGAAIGAPGRVERDKWIQQARALAGAGTEQ
ncbi:MAG: hypothetical protein CTY15_02060 [Methylocystis sp.]|nr:MAG: hypothetical protein CTY15_02060 [Methylocystis sp.]